MADISQEINNFKNAIYGEEVRGSMISLAEKLNQEVENNTQNTTTMIGQAQEALNAANQASQAAEKAVGHANDITAQYKQYADEKLAQAQQAVEDAEQQATAAAGSASAAASSAILAGNSAATAQNEADRAAMYADFVTPDFIIQDNRLYINDNSTVNFEIYENKLYFKLPTAAA